MSDEAEQPNQDYATPNRLAMYLEMGWSDFLLPPEMTARGPATPGWPDPKQDAVHPDFYRRIAGLCSEWCAQAGLVPATTCDVGAAVGRLSYELALQFSALEHIAAVEPSVGFSTWARLLLCENDPLPPVPRLGAAGRETFSSAARRPEPLARFTKARVRVCTATAEAFAEQGDCFDLVTCLNVVDRHPDPGSLIAALSRLTAPGGILVCSSPLDFKSAWTPHGEAWIESLDALFPAACWAEAGESAVYYEFRSYDRAWTRFNCQVVCKRRLDARVSP